MFSAQSETIYREQYSESQTRLVQRTPVLRRHQLYQSAMLEKKKASFNYTKIRFKQSRK